MILYYFYYLLSGPEVKLHEHFTPSGYAIDDDGIDSRHDTRYRSVGSCEAERYRRYYQQQQQQHQHQQQHFQRKKSNVALDGDVKTGSSSQKLTRRSSLRAPNEIPPTQSVTNDYTLSNHEAYRRKKVVSPPLSPTTTINHVIGMFCLNHFKI